MIGTFFRRAAPLLLAAATVHAAPPAASEEFFERRIRPVLVRHCYSCHSAEAKKVRGGLLLDTRDALLKGGDTGPAVVPGKPDASPLVRALRYEELRMPPAGKLPADVAADFTAWVAAGAPDPRSTPSRATMPTGIDLDRGRQFWAFQPPRRHVAPGVRRSDWPRQPVDAFLLARLEAAGIEPTPPADRRFWVRRVTFDLTGLPPTPDQVDAYLADTAPGADARLVDQLLASPHFGERWARVWLDVARYAEDQAHIVGNDASLTYPNAYLYRDWVIQAFNRDVPYDRFVRLQLAADLLGPDAVADHAALGFLGLGPKYYNRNNPVVMADEWEDRVDVVGRGLLGLTLACARCHDHKYDPISTQDYYALAGVFASTAMFNQPLDDRREKKGDEAKSPKDAIHLVREGKATDLNVAIRGDVTAKGAVVARRFPAVLCIGEPTPFRQGSGRRELADAVVARSNPLAARVFVNRVWAQVFGRPLVGTPSNFGSLGEKPSHPELLDDLAARFMDGGWSLKALVRELALSAAYRQAVGIPHPSDPENRFLGRMSRRRLSVEAWRDGLLAATGRLNPRLGGASVNPAEPTEQRRTVYSHISRLSLNPLLAAFDFPDANLHADRRAETTTPIQKLFVMNSPYLVRLAEAFAARVTADVGGDNPGPDGRRWLERAYLLLYARPPAETEARLGLAYLRGGTDSARRQALAQVLLAANEALYVD